ncbi:MAG: uroporphyrinogen decarboxylase, partial [Caldilineae bacterium]
MDKRTRLETIFAGERADRPGVALWRHWPMDDQRGDLLARSTLQFQQRFDFDF